MRDQLSWLAALAIGLVVQTTLAMHFVPDGWRPDVTRALVLWLAFTGRPTGGMFYAFAAGLGAEAMSGAPLGLAVICRLALYGVTSPARGAVDYTHIVFLLGPFAVVLETLIVWALRAMSFANPVPATVVLGVMLRQSLVEAIAVPVIFVLLEIASGHRTGRQVRL